MRIGITQRVVEAPSIQERRDVLDQRWHDLGKACGIQLIPIPNQPDQAEAFAQTLQLEGLIFSGGNNVGVQAGKLMTTGSLAEQDIALERDHTEWNLLHWAIAHRVPVLGVCRGMQFIHAALGGTLSLIQAEEHAGTTHAISWGDHFHALLCLERAAVNSYHRWGFYANQRATGCDVWGIDPNDQVVEAFSHQTHRLTGIMWHPEREVEFHPADLQVIRTIFYT